jgi:LysM repeat protein
MVNVLQYIIQPGDTLGDLAVWYNTTVKEIKDANPGIDPYNLMAGEMILVPEMLEQRPLPPPPPPPRRRF